MRKLGSEDLWKYDTVSPRWEEVATRGDEADPGSHHVTRAAGGGILLLLASPLRLR